MNKPGRTLFDKLWDMHKIKDLDGEKSLLYIVRHLIHEVTSPLAFEKLKNNSLDVLFRESHYAVADHNVPTDNLINCSKDSEVQVSALKENCNKFGIKYFEIGSDEHGIVHIIGPELGITIPGISIVCGDSHTSTHGAFGALSFGIGTTEIAQVLATQTIVAKKPKNLLVHFEGELKPGISSKDLALFFISQIGASGAKDYAVEYSGKQISKFGMDERMTLCNMGIEAGSKINLIAPDEVTFNYIKQKNIIKKDQFEKALKFWKRLNSDYNSNFDKKINIKLDEIEPMTTWGTNLDTVLPISGKIPNTNEISINEKDQFEKSLDYMGLSPGQKIKGVKINKAFIGSCTNSRISDLRSVASFVSGYKVNPNVHAIIVPGSNLTKKIAEAEGLDIIFKAAGFEWRNPGCSLCLGMNSDQLKPGDRCASSSNRNFEGRQGAGGRTHLMSPLMVAAAAIAGEITDER